MRHASDSTAVLIPAHSEELTIAKIVSESRRRAPMVLVIDDGSSDATGDVARQAGAHVVRHRTRRGVGAALRRGLAYLNSKGYTTVVTLDADGAHDPAFIPTLLRVHREERADFTLGSRFLTKRSAETIPTPKRAANLFARHLLNQALGTQLTDVATGMRVLGPRALAFRLRHSDFGGPFELIACAVTRGLTIAEAPITAHYDAAELHATNRRELLDLLGFVRARLPMKNILGIALDDLTRSVTAFQSARISIEGDEFWLHPIKSIDGYAFQIQDPWYRRLRETTWRH
jgi:glycosyltransferase involved in cell wall biosynthesis